jgi:hypothetical protein
VAPRLRGSGTYQHTRVAMIGTIGKNHGHYQIDQNKVIVKKKTHGKKNRKKNAK